jgi:hypothetical protein
VTPTRGNSNHRLASSLLRLAGAGLLAAGAAIHLDLYLIGYRFIPTIGGLFLVQVIVAFSFAIAVLTVPRPCCTLSCWIRSLNAIRIHTQPLDRALRLS